MRQGRFLSGPGSVAAALVLMLAVAACAPGDQPAAEEDNGGGNGDTAAGDGDTWTIGLSGALTGGDAILGQTQQEGVQLAVRQINDEGGILGREVELLIEDEANDPARMAEIAQRFITRGSVDAILGGTNDGTAEVLSQAAESAGVPLVIPFANGDQITEGAEWTFQVDTATSVFVERYATCAAEQYDATGIIYDDNAFGQSSRDFALATLDEAGQEPVETSPIPDNATDYTAQLSRFREAGAEVLLAPVSGTNAAQLRRDMIRLDWEIPIYGPNSLAFQSMIEIGGDVVEGNPVFLDLIDEDKPAVQEFQEAFEEAYGHRATSGFELLGYDAMMILAHALEEGGGEPEATRDALANLTDYEAVSGAEGSTISYSPDDHRRQDPDDLVWRWVEDGEFRNAPTVDGCPDPEQIG